MLVQVGKLGLHEAVQLVHAEAELGHARLEDLPHAEPGVPHHHHQHGEGFLLGHHHQQQTHDEGCALAVANLPESGILEIS